jgi:hypothetical protein
MNQHHGSRGQVLPLVAICLVVLLGFGGMAVDVGYLQYEQRQQQTAADSGALAGAEYLLKNGGCAIGGTGWQQAARDDSARNGYTHGGTVTVNVNHPVASGPFAGDPCAVQVQVTSPHQTFFAKLFGLAGDETTEAVATISANNNTCAYFLSTTTNTTFDGGTLYGPGCALLTNNPDINPNGTKITLSGYGTSGSLSGSRNAQFLEAQPVKIPPVSDPCPEIAGCAALANNPPSTSPCTHPTNPPGILNPGCYTNDFNINGTTTMNPGLFVITGNNSGKGHGDLSGTGVTIYVASGGSAPSPNGSTWTLSPPTTGAYTGVVYYQVPGNSNAQTFDGTASYMNGLVYAPSVTGVTYNGQSRLYSVVVLGSATYHGNKTSLTYVAPDPGQSLIQNAVLGE